MLFSNLVYRIIGEPETWQEASIEKVHALIDHTVSVDTAENRQELEIANNIIERISNHDDLLKAFQSFLENSRYGLVILGANYNHIYHNEKAASYLPNLHLSDQNSTCPLSSRIASAIEDNHEKNINSLLPISTKDLPINLESIYVKVTHGQSDYDNPKHRFHVLFLPVFESGQISLNEELRNKYKLSTKEESVIIAVIEGKNIKQISEQFFISQNTVKSHLKSIYCKTDTNSQSALIRLFLNHEVQLLESYFDFKMPSQSSQVDFDNHKDLFAILSKKHSLCYRDIGIKDGKPLVVIHNNYGCRFNLPYNAQEICEKTHRRIIIPDRPGYGKSPFIKGYPENWNDLLSELIDFLNIEEFDLLGNILGTTHAINYGLHGDPRLKHIILSSPVFINEDSHRQYLGDVLLPVSKVIKSSKRIAAEIYKLWLRSMLLNVEKHMRHMLSSSLGSKELYLLDDQNFVDVIVKNFNEAQAQSSKGNIQDLLYFLKVQEVALNKIDVPVSIWVGDEDKLIKSSGVEEIFKPIPNHQIYFKQGYGQDIYYSLFEQIIR